MPTEPAPVTAGGRPAWQITMLAVEGFVTACAVYAMAALHGHWTMCLLFAGHAALMMGLARWVQRSE